MYYQLNELKIRPIVTGILSYVPGLFAWWDSGRPMGNTSSSSYSRGIWRFHLKNYNNVYQNKMPSVVVELGPGATLGTCIAALCDGVEKAIGLDACSYASDGSENIRILDELIKDGSPYEKLRELYEAVKNVGSASKETLLCYVAPWTDLKVLAESSVDLIFSHSVMEHVDSPMEAYKACHHWLREGGVMSHKIDHSSHAVTKTWNGHYGIPSFLWMIIFGNRPYLLNRMTPAEHEKLIEAAGFCVVAKSFEVADKDDNSSFYKSTDKNYQIKTSTYICKKI
jgi:SAM-dependent methyltransferase